MWVSSLIVAPVAIGLVIPTPIIELIWLICDTLSDIGGGRGGGIDPTEGVGGRGTPWFAP